MMDVVPELVQLFSRQVWLVPKCGPRVQEKGRLWFKHHRFFERTGIAPENLRFCLEARKATARPLPDCYCWPTLLLADRTGQDTLIMQRLGKPVIDMNAARR